MSSQAVYSVGIPLILALILLEAALGARRRVAYYNSGDTWASLGLPLPSGE